MLTAALTIVGGLLIFALERFVLEPVNDQAKTIGKIAYALMFYGRCLNPPEPLNSEYEDLHAQRREAEREFRDLASQWAANNNAIRFEKLWSLVKLSRNTQSVRRSIGYLFEISNAMYREDNWRGADKIYELLGIRKFGDKADG